MRNIEGSSLLGQILILSRISVTDFFEQNSKIQFGIEFRDVSLLDLITYENVKVYLEMAQINIDNHNYDESLTNSKIAFEMLLYSFELNKKDYSHNNVLDIGHEINNKYEYIVGRSGKEVEWFKDITETTNRIREVLKITALGIDFKRYSVFQFFLF